MRLAIVAWLAIAEPLALAWTLDGALPRLATLGARGWIVIAARVALVAAAIAVARRLHARADGAWRGVAVWAVAAIGVTLLAQAWPVLPSGFAPSESRRLARAALALEAALAGVAWWLARRVTASRDSA